MSDKVSKWKPLGLQSWQVIQLEPGSEFQVLTALKWKDLKSWDTALTGPDSASVFGDLKNFTNGKPVVMKGTEQKFSNLI